MESVQVEARTYRRGIWPGKACQGKRTLVGSSLSLAWPVAPLLVYLSLPRYSSSSRSRLHSLSPFSSFHHYYYSNRTPCS